MKTAEKFLEHAWMHVSQTDSLRRCPLCNKTRAKHKNTDPEVLAARRDPRRGCPYKCCHCRDGDSSINVQLNLLHLRAVSDAILQFLDQFFR